MRVGIVGCGEATQALHLPALRFLADRFRVTAVCDARRHVVESIARRWDVPTWCTASECLVRRDDVDAVLVANPHVFHAETATAAIAEGKHVLIEKPLCVGLREGRTVVAAAEAADVVVQVGYMRRHVSAYERAARLLAELPAIRLARVHAVLGRNSLILGQAHNIVRGDPLPHSLARATEAREAALIAEMLGDEASQSRHAYMSLITLNSHDFSVMRGLLGMPHGVVYAATRGDSSPYTTAAFDYGSFVCHFETGFDEIPRVDTHIEVFADDRSLRLEYDTPFIRNIPVRLRTTGIGTNGTRTEVNESWEDPFVGEWRSFHDAVRHGGPVRTPPADALADLQLARDLIAATTAA